MVLLEASRFIDRVSEGLRNGKKAIVKVCEHVLRHGAIAPRIADKDTRATTHPISP
jgi:hypothetical protein